LNQKKRQPVHQRLVDYVSAKGGVILTEGVVTSSDHVEIRCGCGFEWHANASSLVHGKTWCPKCAGRHEGKAEALVREYVDLRGGEILTKGRLVSTGRVDVRCSCGYEWNVGVGPLYQLETWCPKCAGNFPRSLEELRKIAEARGGKLLSETYTNVDATYDFECSLGHEFSNTFKHVESGGQWCPTCNKPTKSEEIARETLHQIFGVKFPKARPPWLRNSRGYRMELDGYSAELGIAFEYQGIQHFKENTLYNNRLDTRIQDDRRKAELCREQNIKLLILTYEHEYGDFPRIIREQLDRENFDTSKYNFDKEIDLAKAYIRDDRLLALKALLEPKGIEVLSKKWLTTNTKYEFLCRVCGHRWRALGSAFFNSRSVAGCDKCARAKAGEATKLDISSLQDFALSHGGKLLSTKYVRRNHSYKWECKFGHVFRENYNNMAYRNQFCATCEGRPSKNPMALPEALEVLDKFQFDLESEYVSKTKPLVVRCRNCLTRKETSLKHLLDNEGACIDCNRISQAGKAERLMRQAGFTPLEPYKGMSLPWKSQCERCGQTSSPLPSNIHKGQGCYWCYQAKLKKR
jgi:hypothetical protein